MDLIAAALVLVPEVVIAQCHDLEQARGRAVLADADDLARQGRRVLALARKPIRPTEDLEAQVTAGGYGFVALVAMHDLPRRRDPRGRDLGRPSPDRAGHRPRGGHPGRATRLHPHRRRPRDDVMAMPPRPRTERLLSRRLLLSSYLLWGILESAAGFAAYGFVLLGGGWRPGEVLEPTQPLYGQAVAAFFGAIVLGQVANVLIWRTTRQSVFAKGLLANRAVAAGILAELALLWGIVETSPGQALFGTAALPPTAWLVPIPLALGMLGLAELGKAIRRRRRARGQPVQSPADE